ncbi:MAG: GTP cyclohydrolase I FolE [Zavarzinella sp.]
MSSRQLVVPYIGHLEHDIDVDSQDGHPNSGVDHERIQAAVREILLAVGEDPDRDGLLDTPARVARMYAEVFSGLRADPGVHLEKKFDVDYNDVVIQKDISFTSFCEHHMLPFTGKAHIAYIPTGKVVGLSKLARVVEEFARRPQVQERLTQQIADILLEKIDPRGVLVMLEGEHSCMTIRGVRKPGTTCITYASHGIYQTDPTMRQEVLSLFRTSN